MPTTADVIVVGGGINGASIAFNLAQRGIKVTLVEKTFIAGGPTGRSSAIIRQHYSNEVTARMALRSLQIFQNFDDVVGGTCDFRQTGFLLGARAEDLEALNANVALQQSVGINTRVVSPEEIGEIEPFMSLAGIVAAAYEAESGYADPASTTNAYARRAKELGATLMLNTKALAVNIEKGRITDDSQGHARCRSRCRGRRTLVATVDQPHWHQVAGGGQPTPGLLLQVALRVSLRHGLCRFHSLHLHASRDWQPDAGGLHRRGRGRGQNLGSGSL
jgi:glycine/D-amino acid oxidase-like deaminating enzyme